MGIGDANMKELYKKENGNLFYLAVFTPEAEQAARAAGYKENHELYPAAVKAEPKGKK